ncbi:hypothetical protein DWV16_06615 [Anaerotruncus sp. AF02-27]|uniref:hypothetical protein n=1 Tax=Anaerotruncus TaxID=244127 RepID=UPI000E525765|nr:MULTISPECIES: hypothetical protein [Anaerotruncus]RGX56015.1 hypothetical protein DWV16_06615 [Anaerotruncus sp. AF02-27]
MDDLAVRLAEVDQRGKSNSHRIDDLEKRADTLQELTTSVKLLAANMERMASEQMKQGDRLTALEKQPGERWNSMTRTIFTTVVSALAGGLVAVLTGLVK